MQSGGNERCLAVGQWWEWLDFQIPYREAEALIKGKVAEPKK
jgi:hypothetical protein